MKYNDQLFKHDPDNDVFGDCYRTCIANLLDLEPADVPNFADPKQFPSFSTSDVRHFLAERGYGIFMVIFDADPDTVLALMGENNPSESYIMTGLSANGTNHCVTCTGGEIEHDPAIDKSGIVDRASDGYTWIEIINGAK